MQFNGIGSGHNPNTHYVTECIHDNSHYRKEGEFPGSASSMANSTRAMQAEQQEGQFSLSAWLEKALGNGKKLLRAAWGGNETVTSGEAGDKSGEAQVLAQIREDSAAEGISANVAGQDSHQPDTSGTLHTPQIAAAASAVRQPQNVEDNVGLSDIENAGSQQAALWQKIKVKFKDAAGQLSGYLTKRFAPGKFADFQAKNSFQAKQEKQKEDLRKTGKFRRDVVEIDHAQIEDNYLLDSYDKRGEYSKLSANK